MEATVSTSVTIDAAPSKVFEYLADLKYHYLWNPQIKSISPIKPLELGMKYKTESQVLGSVIEAVNNVTVFDAPKELTLENSFGAVKYQANFRLMPEAGKTRLKLSVSLSTDKKVYVFTIPVLKQLALRELRTDLQALKIAVENNLS